MRHEARPDPCIPVVFTAEAEYTPEQFVNIIEIMSNGGDLTGVLAEGDDSLGFGLGSKISGQMSIEHTYLLLDPARIDTASSLSGKINSAIQNFVKNCPIP